MSTEPVATAAAPRRARKVREGIVTELSSRRFALTEHVH